MKKKIVGIFVCILLIATMLPAIGAITKEEVEINTTMTNGWTKTYGGGNFDFLSSIIPTIDGGYLLGGKTYTWSEGIGDVWLIKTDSEGNEIWNTSFGGVGIEGGPDDLLQLDDGSFIIPTVTDSFGSGGFDTWLIKTDNEGNMIWNKTYGGKGFDFGGNLCETDDGGYLLSGTTDSYGAGKTDAWLLKTDCDGNEIWNKTYGGPEEEMCYFIESTDDGGYILCGEKYTPKEVFWLIKIDADGNLIWENTYRGKIGHSIGCQAYQTDDGGYIVGGDTNILYFGNIWLGKSDIWLVKTDAQGNKLWDKKIGRFIFEDSCGSVFPASDGGYILSGYTRGFGGFLFQSTQYPPWKKASVIKTDANGNVEWEEHFGNGICFKAVEIDDSIFGVAGIEQPGKSWDGALIKLE